MRTKQTKLKHALELAGLAACLAAVTTPTLAPSLLKNIFSEGTQNQPCPVANTAGFAWWDNIGGCGVGGGGGGGGGGAKWIGRGVTGGLVDLESKETHTPTSSNQTISWTNRIGTHIGYRYNLGVTIPVSTKTGTYKFRSDEGALDVENSSAGIGDLGIDFSRSFGHTGALSASISASIPIGKHNIRKSYPDPLIVNQTPDGKFYLPPELQQGSGLFSSTVGLDYAMDKDWGPILMGLTYTSMFLSPADLIKAGAQNKLHKKDATGKYIDFREHGSTPMTAAYAADSETKENLEELKGDYFGNSIGTSLAAGYKTERFVQSIQFTYSYKIKQDWYVRVDDPVVYIDAATGAYHFPAAITKSRNNFSLSYGIEWSLLYSPIFLATTTSFNEEGFTSFTSMLGVKATFF